MHQSERRAVLAPRPNDRANPARRGGWRGCMATASSALALLWPACGMAADGVGALVEVTGPAAAVAGVLAAGAGLAWNIRRRTLGAATAAHQRDLKDREQRLQGIMDTVPDALVTVDETGLVRSFNPGAERIFGYTAAEIIGQPLATLMPDPRADTPGARLIEYLRAGDSKAVGIGREALATRRNGAQFPIELTLSELQHGPHRLAIVVIRDISERKRTMSRLLVAEKVLDSTSEGVMVTDSDCTILWVNQAFFTISGYCSEDVLGRRSNLLASGLQDKAFYAAMWESINGSGEWAGEIWNRRKDGEAYPEWLTIRALAPEPGVTQRYVGIFSDISKHKRAEATIKALTYYDGVTRLPNRHLFQDRFGQALERGRRTNRKVALVLVSLDRFKTVNETLGHQTGDALLRSLAERLGGALRTEDTVARLRGDTFVCVLSDLSNVHDATPIIARIVDCTAASFVLERHELFVTASVGISLYPMDGHNVDDLIQKAETAMNRSKDRAENTYHYYTPEMNSNSREQLQLETDLRKAIGRDEFELYYQPKVETHTGRIVGAEALLRWRHAELGMVPPSRFIPIAEDNGMIVPLGAWVLRAACEQIRRWEDAGIPVVKVAVNLSAHQFRQPDLLDSIVQILEDTGVAAENIELELTESAVMRNADQAVQTLMGFHDSGLTVAIDDFGTGYSSLSYLKRFPIDKLKIDRSFVQDLGATSAGTEIVQAIIAMAHSLGLSVVAEGVETDEQLALLRALSCDEIQGYYFSPPVPADRFADFLREGEMVGRLYVA